MARFSGFGVGDFPDEAGVIGEAADDGGVVLGVAGEAHEGEGLIDFARWWT